MNYRVIELGIHYIRDKTVFESTSLKEICDFIAQLRKYNYTRDLKIIDDHANIIMKNP